MLNLKITAVIIEKTPNELKKIQSLLKKVEQLSVIAATTEANQAITLISNNAPSLIFVGMDLKSMNGIEFVQLLQNRNTFPEVIFLAYDFNKTYDTLAVEPFDYLLKPLKKETIEKSLVRLKDRFRKTELMRRMEIFTKQSTLSAKRIFKQKGGIIIITLEEIVYCKAELTRTLLILRCGTQVHLTTSITDTIETINSKDFSKVGRSHCINRNYLRKIDKRQNKCYLHYFDKSWAVPASQNTILQLEKLNVANMY